MEQQQRKENHGGVIWMPPFYDSLSILHSDSPAELFWLMDISYQLVLVKKKNGVATEVAQWL